METSHRFVCAVCGKKEREDPIEIRYRSETDRVCSLECGIVFFAGKSREWRLQESRKNAAAVQQCPHCNEVF